MPVDKFVSLATAIVLGTMIAHPFDWRVRLLKVQYSILREVSDTRSWGNPSIFKPRHMHVHRRGQGNGQKDARESGQRLRTVMDGKARSL
jgi:hypothetical protein